MRIRPLDLEARRQAAIEQLSEAYAHDQIDDEELEARIERVEQASTDELIAAQLADLSEADAAQDAGSAALTVTGARSPVLAADRARAGTALELAPDTPERSSVVTVFGSATRDRQWTVPRQLRVVSVFSGTDLDFREARLAPGVTEINIVSVMAGVRLVVPPGLPVEVDGTGILGSFEHRLGAGGDDGAPDAAASPCRLRIKGVALLSGVDIEDRLVGESRRQARQRRKKGRAAIAAAAADRRLTEGRRR